MPDQTYIQQIKELEKNYKPNSAVASVLANKYLVFLVGPLKVGKSTLMNKIVLQDAHFSRIGGFTTRDPRPEDELGLYRYWSNDDKSLARMIAKIRAGDLVQYAVHPTTDKIYATELDDFSGLYNCKDVFGHAIGSFRALPSAGSYSFSIVCEPDQWMRRIIDNYPDQNDSDLQKRLIEAKINLSWSLQDNKTIWIDNSDGNLGKAAAEILKYCTTNRLPNPTQQAQRRKIAKTMLDKL